MDGIQEKSMLCLCVLIFIFIFVLSLPLSAEITTKNKYRDSMKGTMNELKDYINSQKFSNTVKDNIDIIRQQPMPDVNNYFSSGKPRKSNPLTIKGSYFLFISSSVPIETLQAYAHDISENNLPVKMVLRGFIGGMKKIKPTVQFIKNIIYVDKECLVDCKTYDVDIEIDPELFGKLGIESVPAFSDSIGSKIVYGDADIAYLIDRITQH